MDKKEKNRGVDLQGQQIRARQERPSAFEKDSFRTKNLGKGEKQGKMQLVLGRHKNDGYGVQSERLNLSKIKSKAEAIRMVKEDLTLTKAEEKRAIKLVEKYYKAHNPGEKV